MGKKYYLVYQTTNKVNEKIYIGVHRTYDVNDSYLGSGKLLSRAIRKYGKDNFDKDILFVCDNITDMYLKEIEIVNEEFVKREDTYNIRCGGLGGRMNAETRIKVSEALKGKKKSEKTKSLMSASQTGKILSEETKKRISESRNKSGFRPNEESRNKMSVSAKNRKNNSIGTVWITDGQNNKRIYGGNLIPEGWRKGRSKK